MKHDLGKWGEGLACDYLVSKGYRILEKNWRSAPYELDIVAQFDGQLRVIEVKTRRSEDFDLLTLISRKKRKNLVQAANLYLEEKAINWEVIFDVVMITWLSGSLPKIYLVEDAFQAIFL